MRIVAGQFKGRPLQAPKTQATRPTSDRARESLFNMLMHADWAPALEEARVIDLFAGSNLMERILPKGLIRNYVMTKQQELTYHAELSEAERIDLYLDTV